MRLAEAKLLGKFHYLSTVSGGGYIGSWLSAWIAREGSNTVMGEINAIMTMVGNLGDRYDRSADARAPFLADVQG